MDPSTGYAKVRLWVNGRRLTCSVHRLVCAAFHGKPAAGLDACHNDGDRLNNRADNLRWGSRSENNLDAVAHGTNRNAAKTHCDHGHELTAANVYPHATRRQCKTCARERARAQRERARMTHVA